MKFIINKIIFNSKHNKILIVEYTSMKIDRCVNYSSGKNTHNRRISDHMQMTWKRSK